ncbi:MAG: CoA transferase [Chloroflexi bacterium]|nr:CoA transferase [Chloroflexota bacterium]
MPQRAFEGVKVADFSWIGVGPITMKYLADHGATVVRIESATRPDGLRLGRPAPENITGINRSQFYADFNSSKLSMSLNLSHPKGRAVARKMVEWADVVAESYTPKAMKAWGLDYESIRQFKPEIVMLSTCQQGQTGPYNLFAGYGFTGAAMAGLFQVTGWPDRPPTYIYGAYTDFVAPHFAATAVIAALDYKRRTGKGQYIDQAQVEAGVHFTAPAVLDYSANGRIAMRNGNRSPMHAPHGAYRALGEDRWVAIAVQTDEEWAGLGHAMGDPEWSRDPRFATLRGRKAHEEELDRLVEGWTAGLDPAVATDLLQAHGVPAGTVARVQDLFADPQLAARGHHRRLVHTEMGEVAYNGPTFRLSATPDNQFAAPCLGEHTDMVLRDFLGMGDDEITDLLVEGVLE